MKGQKDTACRRAAFIYRTLGNPTVLSDPRFVDVCGLMKEKPDPNDSSSNSTSGTTDDPLYVDEEFEKTLIGKRIFFKTPKQMWSMKVYEPFVISEEQSIQRSVGMKQFEQALNMVPEKDRAKLKGEMQEKYNRMHWYSLTEDMGSIIFFAEDKKGEKIKMLCDDENSSTKISRATTVSGARACFSNIYRHPTTGERLESGSSLLQIEHKGELYMLLLGVGKNYNKAKHEKILKAMARSLRMEGDTELPTVTLTKCKDDGVLQLKKGIPVSWIIIDRTREARIVQQPKLARDHEIGNAVSNYYGMILKAMEYGKDGKQILSFGKQVIVDRDLRKSLITAGGFAMDHAMKEVRFVPVEVEDYSNFEMDGALASAAIFYMKALTKVSSGIGGLGKSMSEKHMRLYWEIPVIRIQGECIPQMVCKDGKWVPDRNNMEYREISKKPDMLRSANKDFLTVEQVRQDLDRYYYHELDKAEKAEGDYYNVAGRCDRAKSQLYKIDFPVNIDKCPKLENQIQQVQYEQLVFEQMQKVRTEELRRWLSVLKPGEVSKYTLSLTGIRTQLAAMRAEVKRLIPIRDGLLESGEAGQASAMSTKIQFLQEDIAVLEGIEASTQKSLDRVNSGKHELSLTNDLKTINTEITKLKKKRETLKKELAICVKQNSRIR